MVIAIASDGNTLEDHVSQQFVLCKYLLVVETSDLSLQAIENDVHFPGELFAKKVIDYDCEGIITGELTHGEFNVLADAYITRYLGSGYSGITALDLMKKRELKLIRTYDGSEKCEENHHIV